MKNDTLLDFKKIIYFVAEKLFFICSGYLIEDVLSE